LDARTRGKRAIISGIKLTPSKPWKRSKMGTAKQTFAYPEVEHRECLRRAFQGQDASTYIRMDGHAARGAFLRENWNFALEQGWIRVEKVELEQEVFMKGFLTAKGKSNSGYAKGFKGRHTLRHPLYLEGQKGHPPRQNCLVGIKS
jgi:hypothetical protein